MNGFGYSGPNVLVNKAYSFTEGQTLADLFAAAKAAGDIKDYEFSNPYGSGEYLASVTMPDGTVVSDPTGAASYWANFKNGSYASGAACQAGDKLAAGDAFQFAFTDLVVNRAPSADEWAALKDKAEGVAPSKPGQSGSTNQGKPSTANSNKYDAAKAETLIANLSARFAINGKDHAIDNNTFYAAIALNSLGKGASIDAAAILANLNKDDLMTAGRMGKYIMALTAAGIDCTKVNDNGTVRNLVAEMEALEKPESMSVYDAVCILPVYQYGSYKQGDSAMAPSALIDLILANADDKGLFGSAQPDEQVAQQQAQEQSASASSTSVKQSTSGQPDNSQDGGDKASSAEDGKAKDENSLTDSSQEQSEGSSSEQASQSGASSGRSGASGSAASNASENSGSASSSGSAPAYQEPEPEPAPAPAPSTISVYISIDSSRAKLWPGRLLLWLYGRAPSRLHGVRRPVRDRRFHFRFVLLCKRHQRSRREAMWQWKRLDICRERVVPGEGLRTLHAFRWRKHLVDLFHREKSHDGNVAAASHANQRHHIRSLSPRSCAHILRGASCVPDGGHASGISPCDVCRSRRL